MNPAPTGDLATLSPGPELAAALGAVELSTTPNDRMLEVLAAQYRQLCHEQARMVAVLAEVGRCAGYPEPGEVTRLDAPERYAPEETRAALRWTRRAADAEHDLAEAVVHGMPVLHAAWTAGEVDRPRVLVFERYLCGLTAEQVDAVCAVAVPRAPRLTTGQLAVLLRRMVLAVDPDAAERWYRKGIRERNVTAVMAPDGTVTMSANGLPADAAEAACVRVQDLAAAAKRAGHPGRIGQIRCDLFLGLLDGRFHGLTTPEIVTALLAEHDDLGSATADPAGPDCSDAARRDGQDPAAPEQAVPARRRAAGPGPDARSGIEIRVALSTLLGRDEQPGEIPGLGLLPAPAARARVALQRRAQWRFAVTDAEGRLVSEGRTPRRPERVGPFPVRSGGMPGGIVEIAVPESLLDELTRVDGPADGWAAIVADLAAQHARRDAHLVDLDARPGARLPSAALRRHTEIRDRTCAFPGCRRRAHGADIDHSRDHATGGATVRANSGPLCDHDHDVKHRGGWRLTQPEPGEFVWHSPLGGRYRTRGEFLLPPMPDPRPSGPDPVLDRHVPITIDGPILQPYRPVERPRPPPPRSTLPDDPPF